MNIDQPVVHYTIMHQSANCKTLAINKILVKTCNMHQLKPKIFPLRNKLFYWSSVRLLKEKILHCF